MEGGGGWSLPEEWRNGREDGRENKVDQKCCGGGAVCAVQGGTSLLIRSLGRVGPFDWLLPGEEQRLLTASYGSRDFT